MTGRTKSRSRWTDDRGQIVILTALSMVVLMGIAALSIDASFMYDKRNRLHAAADAAAKSAALEKFRNPSISQTFLETFADQQVSYHGFTSTRVGGTTTVVVNSPPTSGAFAGQPTYVEVIASEPTGTFFGTVLGLTSMTPGARAVAGNGPSPYCIYTLDSGASSFTIGTSNIAAPTCSISDSGNLDTSTGAVAINAASIAVTGVCTGASCPQPNERDGSPAASDPLTGLAAPTMPGACATSTATVVVNSLTCDAIVIGGGAATTINPGKYRILDGTATQVNLTLLPGTYYFTGPFMVGNNSTVTGSGVLLYFSGISPVGDCTLLAIAGCVSVANNATWNLTAQTSGTYRGILLFAASTNGLKGSFDGNNPLYNLSGAMYFPSAELSFRNGMNTTNDCTLIVARWLTIQNGNGSFSNTCAAYGGSPIEAVSIAE